MNPFTVNSNGKEVFNDEIVEKSGIELLTALFTIALSFGIDRTENAVKETFNKQDLDEIIAIMNTAMELSI